MQKTLTTADVPPRFLKAAYLVGHVPLMALQSDPRVSYALYIPPDHYSTAERKLPLLTSVHGTRRGLSSLYTDLAAFADSAPCAILAPVFPAGLEGANDLDSYKVLKSSTLRSDLALLAMLGEVTHRWPGLRTDKVFMMGYSGGGQFAQRFAFLHPGRLAAASIGAPGSVTLLDAHQSWPRGIADVESIFARRVDAELIKQVPIQLVIGSEDTKVHGGEAFGKWLKQVKRALAIDNESSSSSMPATTSNGRVQILRELQENLQENDIECRFDVIPHVAHSAKGAQACMLQFIHLRMQ